jgi:endonuclease/exonuclease/phosphatase family metal-dependent hydrolase
MVNIRIGALVFLLFSIFACQRKMAGQTTPAHKTTRQELRILSYNIHHANPPAKPALIDIDAIARVINDAKPDIVALQEVDKNTTRSGNIDEAKLIAEKTGMRYRFYKAIDHSGGDYGLAILSRFELKEPKLVHLPQEIKAENRILAYATLNVDAQQFIIANTHLDATRSQENRVVQMKEILKTFEQEKLPVILCGDLNSVAGSEPINLLDSLFKRTCLSDCAGTVPQDKPFRTIDFIAVRNNTWPLLSYEVIAETYASDHRPVLAVFNTGKP